MISEELIEIKDFGEKEALASEFAYKRACDPDYLNSREQDFENFGDEYFKIIEIIDGISSDCLDGMLSGDPEIDILTLVRKVKGEVIGLTGRDKIFKISCLRKWMMDFFQNKEDVYNNGNNIRTKNPRRLSIQKRVNSELMECAESVRKKEGKLSDIIDILKRKRTFINGCHIATVMHRVDLQAIDQEASAFLYELNEILKNRMIIFSVWEACQCVMALKDMDSATLPDDFISNVMKGQKGEYNNVRYRRLLVFCLTGLRNLSANQVPREFLEMIAAEINGQYRFNEEEIGIGVFSLRNMIDENVPRELFEGFIRSFDPENMSFNNSFIGRCLYGLQGLSNESVPEEFFEAFSSNIDEYILNLSGMTLINSLWGLANFSNISGAKVIIEKFFEKIEYLLEMGISDLIYIPYIVQVYRLYGKFLPLKLSNLYQSVIRINPDPSESYYEEIVSEVVLNNFPSVSINKFLDGFEMDFFDSNKRINLEIDGRQHAKEPLKDEIRDKFLRLHHGIKVVRINVPSNSLKRRVFQLFK
ncbi:hypothetical protein GF354_04685 [Candidatus Peregrinibacteria bacterium]|nr:hypothetical protein [Candidatus Peregrinibacteria bacterium]